jgi:hypothetical protein
VYRLRKEDLSLYRYFRDIVLKDSNEYQEKDELVFNNDQSTSSLSIYNISTLATPNPFEHGRGIVYFDNLDNTCLVNTTTISGTPEQSNRVFVYDESLNLIDENSYRVDYTDGTIITSPLIVPKYIDFYWYYISLVDEWSNLSVSTAPVVVLDISGTTKTGYQLGGGKKIIRKCNIYTFSSSSSERSDITELIYDNLYLKNCPLYDFERGSALDFDGTFFNRRNNYDKTTNLYSRATVSGTSNLRFEEVESRNINIPLAMSSRNEAVTLSDLNAFRSRISFDLVSFTGS